MSLFSKKKWSITLTITTCIKHVMVINESGVLQSDIKNMQSGGTENRWSSARIFQG